MGIFDFFKKKKKSNDSVEKFEEFSKSIDTSSFSETQKKSTEKFFSDIKKNIKDKDGQPDTITSNKVEDVIKNEQSNSEERLEIITDGKVYRLTGSENIRKTKELNDPKKNNISSLFNLNEYYDNGRIKKETEKSTEEVEIMRLAKSIETSSSFVSLVELLPTNLSDYEGETFYDVTEEFRILLKNGSEVARGFVCISHNANYWDDDDESHDDIQSHNEVMIVNGKQFTDYDDEKWGEQEVKGRELESLESKRIATFWDDGEAEEFFNSYIDKKCNKFK